MTTAANDNTNPTLLDLVRNQDPSGAQAKVVEALMKRCPLMQQLTFIEGNLETGHKFVTRTGLPSIGWRRYNEGVASGKSRVDQIVETCGMLEGRSLVDAELAQLNGNQAAFRASEDLSFLASFHQEVETGLFYHSTKTNPEKFMGLSPRLDSLSGPYSKQIVPWLGSSSGNDQTSVWLMAFSPDTVFGIVPKGQPAGLVPHDMGVQMVTDANSNRFRAYETVWNWKLGLCVKDARYVVRIPNVDTGALDPTNTTLIDTMINAYHQLQDRTTGRICWFTNRLVGQFLHRQAMNKGVYGLTIENDLVNGGAITKFLGFPILETDALLSTESVVA